MGVMDGGGIEGDGRSSATEPVGDRLKVTMDLPLRDRPAAAPPRRPSRHVLLLAAFVTAASARVLVLIAMALHVSGDPGSDVTLWSRAMAIIVASFALDMYLLRRLRREARGPRPAKGSRSWRVLYRASMALLHASFCSSVLLMALCVVEPPGTLVRETVGETPSAFELEVHYDVVSIYMMSESVLRREVNYTLTSVDGAAAPVEGTYRVHADTAEVDPADLTLIRVPGQGRYALQVSLIDTSANYDYVVVMKGHWASPDVLYLLLVISAFSWLVGTVAMLVTSLRPPPEDDGDGSGASEDRFGFYICCTMILAVTAMLCAIFVLRSLLSM